MLDVIWERPWLYPKQRRAVFNRARYSLIEASAQPLDCAIQTPTGPRRFGDLEIGDEVFAADGTITRVAGIYPQGVKPVYELTFGDGAITRSTGDHLWLADHYRDGPKVRTLDYFRGLTARSLRLWRFPINAPLRYPARPVPIDPWLLGVLLGDGSLCGNALSVSSADLDLIERVCAAVPAGYEVKRSSEHCWRIVAKVRGAGYERRSIHWKAGAYEVAVARRYVGRAGNLAEAEALHEAAMQRQYGEDVPAVNLRRALRELGLLGLKHHEKFVPALYLHNAAEIRIEVLRGLLDTDGSAGLGNGALIEQTSPRLAEDIDALIRSLGGVCRTAFHPPRRHGWKPSYRINLRHDDIASFFWLARKRRRRAAWRTSVVRKLVKVARVDDAPTQCIAVEHPSQMYLTDHCVPTHNTKAGKTHACLVWLIELAFAGRAGQNFWWVAPVSEQALIAFNRAKRQLPRASYATNETHHWISLSPLGTKIWFKSADRPDGLYGEDVYGAVLDEASRMKEDAWVAVRTTLTATRGPVRIIGNVKGRKNWFYRMARRAEGGEPGMSYHKIVAHDAVEAGVLAEEEIADARAQMPEHLFRELYFAEAADDTGNPFGIDDIHACIKPGLSKLPVVAWGWDLAKTQDYTVGVGLDARGSVSRFERWRGVPWGEQMARIRRLTANVPALVDQTGVGDPIVEGLARTLGSRFEGYQFTAPAKQMLMEGLAVDIQSRKVGFPDGPIVVELEQFEYELRPGGSVRYAAAEGMHDDCVCALALARHRQRTFVPRRAVFGHVEGLA